MPSHSKDRYKRNLAPSVRPSSIRDELEQRAWLLNPGLANRLASHHHNQRRYQPRKGGGSHDNFSAGGNHRIMGWKDRSLLTLGAVLMMLFVIRAETASADEQKWGLQLISKSGVYTALAIDTGIQLDITGLIARVEITQRFTNHGSPSTSLITFNDGESVYAQLMRVPPLADAINPQPREVILIIDTSGSMEGASLVQAKAALSHALTSLGPDDFFNLLQFNSNTEQLFDQSVPVTQTSLYVAQNFIIGLDANGGTDMTPAIRMALSLPEMPQLMRQVPFITDGAVGNETDLLQMVARKLGSAGGLPLNGHRMGYPIITFPVCTAAGEPDAKPWPWADTRAVDSRVQQLVIDDNIERLTLLTCYPFDALVAGGPLRWVVTALPEH